MKKIISVLLTVVIFTMLLSGCGKGKTEIEVYFKNSQSNELSKETRSVDAGENPTETDLAKLAVAQLIKGPTHEKNSPVIDPKAKLLSLTISEGVATVNMSKHFAAKKGIDALLLRFAFINTLCTIDGIDGIVIQVEGKPIVSENTGREYGVLSMSDIALNTEDNARIKLYFPDADGNSLRLEMRTVDVQQTLSLEKSVISELIKGPTNKNLQSSIPVGT